jgi:ABC-type antimicrobial peptide transport system ATPase subunit
MAIFNSYVKLPEGTSWGMIDKHTAESTKKNWALSGDSMEMNHGQITHSMIKKRRLKMGRTMTAIFSIGKMMIFNFQ